MLARTAALPALFVLAGAALLLQSPRQAGYGAAAGAVDGRRKILRFGHHHPSGDHRHGNGGGDHDEHDPEYMPHVRLHIDLSQVPFWQKHFSSASHVTWDTFVECLILEHVGGEFELTRKQAIKLSPYFDANGDSTVTNDEFTAFVRMYGGHDDSADTLRKALQEGLVKMGAISGESRNKDGQSGNEVFGCGVELDRKEAEYIELMASGGLQFAGTSTFTLEMWMMPKDVAKVYTLISKYNRGKWGQYMVRLQPGGNVFFHREVAPWGQKTSEALTPGMFHHVAATYKNGWSNIYVNGSLWASQKEGGQDNNPETPVLVGALLEKGNPMEFFNGVVDEVRIWSVARSQDEIRASMHLSLTGSEDGLVGYWPFDECTGERARDRKGRYDGVLHGGTWVNSPIRFATYKDTFGCVDTLC